MAIWRRQTKLDEEILTVVDGTCQGKSSGGGLEREKGPWATVGDDSWDFRAIIILLVVLLALSSTYFF